MRILEGRYDLREQFRPEARSTLGIQVESVPLVMLRRDDGVKNDHFDVALIQTLNDSLDIGCALCLAAKEAKVVAARLQDHKLSAGGNRGVDATQHAAGSVENHS